MTDIHFDNHLQRLGYRVEMEAPNLYNVYAPKGMWIKACDNIEDARSYAQNHFQMLQDSSGHAERLRQEIEALKEENAQLRLKLDTMENQI